MNEEKVALVTAGGGQQVQHLVQNGRTFCKFWEALSANAHWLVGDRKR